MNTFTHLSKTFAENEHRFPDLMEPYSIMLSDAGLSVDERIRIMRNGLAQTFHKRFPEAEARTVVGFDEKQGALAI